MSLNLLNGNNEALELLDWPQLVAEISSLAHFELNQHKLLKTLIAKDEDAIRFELDQLDQYLQDYDDFNFHFNSKIRMVPTDSMAFDLTNDIAKGKFFEAGELHAFAQVIECYIDSYSQLQRVKFNRNFDIEAATLSKLRRGFLNPLRDFVDHNGNVSYERHPLLRKLYGEVLALEQDLRTSIQKISRNDLYSNKLQMENYDIINDRYVLAVRSDSYQSELGPIVARSQSGMTLFVEPMEVREKGNKRIHLLSEIESTILKLTIELSKFLHNHHHDLQTTTDWLKEIDWLNTKATYSVKRHLQKPHLNNKFIFTFEGLFHPLLNNPVKNDVKLDSDHKGLIISGPNTGGKTVALKSVSLSMLMLHMGLFLPARHADVHPIKDLFYFSHDHQNLAAGLSSFASESKYYLELLESLAEVNLIIIDEIFNSTSSEEASALAIAFLDEVHLRSQSKVILSTHHQVLKTFMHQRSDYVSAHVGYDFEANRPTYRLILGEPGSSLAFKIFENLSEKYGLQTSISEKARSLLDNKQFTYETLLQELSQKKIEVDKILAANRNLQVELKNQKASMEGVLYLERERILNDYSKKIKSLFDQAEKVLTEVKGGQINSRKGLNNAVGTIQSALFKEAPEKKSRVENQDVYSHLKPVAFTDIQPQMTLFSVALKKTVKVQQINPRKKEVQIQHGPVSVWVSAETLRYPSGHKSPVPRIDVIVQREVRGDIEIDCRGMRLEEFQKICEQSIDEVITGEIPFVTIIHGHGDGILKNWLRTYLKREHRDLRWENIEGNDGCTKIFN